MKYRIAKPNELKDISQFKASIPVFEAMIHANGHDRFKHIDLDIEKLYKWVKDSEENPLRFTRLVMSDDGVVVGGIAGELVSYIYTSNVFAVDQLLYLDPTVKPRAFLFALLDEFVRWAIHSPATDVMIGNTTGYKLEHFDKLAHKLGFELATVGYVRKLK